MNEGFPLCGCCKDHTDDLLCGFAHLCGECGQPCSCQGCRANLELDEFREILKAEALRFEYDLRKLADE